MTGRATTTRVRGRIYEPGVAWYTKRGWTKFHRRRGWRVGDRTRCGLEIKSHAWYGVLDTTTATGPVCRRCYR